MVIYVSPTEAVKLGFYYELSKKYGDTAKGNFARKQFQSLLENLANNNAEVKVKNKTKI